LHVFYWQMFQGKIFRIESYVLANSKQQTKKRKSLCYQCFYLKLRFLVFYTNEVWGSYTWPGCYRIPFFSPHLLVT